MNRPAAAWFAGLLVGAATATAAWVRLAGHPPVKAATRVQLAAIQACIRALEALPTREWDGEDGNYSAHVPHDHTTRVEGCFRCDLSDDEVGTPQRRGQDGPLAPRDPATGTPGGSEPARPAESRTGRSGVERTVMTDKVPFVAEIRAEIDRLAAAERTGRSGAVTTYAVGGYTDGETVTTFIHPGEPRITEEAAKRFREAWLERLRGEGG